MIAATQTNMPFSPVARDVLVARLKAAGLRVTEARVALLDALSKSAQPITIDQLFAMAGGSTCDLVTIYRSVAAFERAGVVYRTGYTERGAILYKADVGGRRHFSVVCKGIEAVDELDEVSAAELQSLVEKIKGRLAAKGYAEVDYIVEFFAKAPATPPQPEV
jgi:Fur family transcriptional regulator, ferric uptake regulator